MHSTLNRIARDLRIGAFTAHPAGYSPVRPRREATPDTNQLSTRPWALVVDANASDNACIAHAVAALGYEVVTASDAQSGRQRLLSRGGHPNLVVLDGATRHALGLMGSVRSRHEVPVVVAATRGSRPARFLGSQADGYLVKPLNLARAITELRAATRRTPAQRLAIRKARALLADEI